MRERGRARRSGRPPAAPGRAARPSPCTPTRCSSSPPRPRRPRRRRRPPRRRRTAAPPPRRRAGPRGRSGSSRPSTGGGPEIEPSTSAPRSARGLGRDCVQVGEQRARRRARAATASASIRRDDREHDVGGGDDLGERPAAARDRPRARAAPSARSDRRPSRRHARPAAQQRAADCAPHRPGADDADGRHRGSLGGLGRRASLAMQRSGLTKTSSPSTSRSLPSSSSAPAISPRWTPQTISGFVSARSWNGQRRMWISMPCGSRREALLVEQPRDLGDRLVLAHPLERGRPANEKAAPGAARLRRRSSLAVRAAQRRVPVRIVASRRCSSPPRSPRRRARPQPIEHPRPAGLAARRRRSIEEAGVIEDPEVPADGVLVQFEPTGEIADTQPVGCRAKLVDDLYTVVVGQGATDGGWLGHCTKSIGKTRREDPQIC